MITIKVPVQIIKKRCACQDCQYYRSNPMAYSYMNHGGRIKEDPKHGVDFEEYYDWETQIVEIEGFISA